MPASDDRVIPAAIPAPDGYRPVFADMGGMTAIEYRTAQHNKKPEADPEAIRKTYGRLKSWAMTAEAHNTTTYYVKKAVRGRGK